MSVLPSVRQHGALRTKYLRSEKQLPFPRTMAFLCLSMPPKPRRDSLSGISETQCAKKLTT